MIGDKLYVVGGWQLGGQIARRETGHWQPDALVYDFAKPDAGWQKLPLPEFKRRALAAGIWQGKLFAIGGMDEKAKLSLRVDFFDPQSGKWSEGPEAARRRHGRLRRLRLEPRRRFVRVRPARHFVSIERYGVGMGRGWPHGNAAVLSPTACPAPHGGLLAVGGASMNGHLATIERIELNERHTSPRPGTTKTVAVECSGYALRSRAYSDRSALVLRLNRFGASGG